jgi:hypothetical protein
MKKYVLLIRLLTFSLVLCLLQQTVNSQVHVKGHYRNGTYVRPHYRSNPDGNFYNNWSTKGNYNPYTGAEGTRVTPPYHSSSNRYSYNNWGTGVSYNPYAELAGTRVTPSTGIIYFKNHSLDKNLSAVRKQEENISRPITNNGLRMLYYAIGDPLYSNLHNAIDEERADNHVVHNEFSSTEADPKGSDISSEILRFNNIHIFSKIDEVISAHPDATTQRDPLENVLIKARPDTDPFGRILYHFDTEQFQSFQLIFSANYADTNGGFRSLMEQAAASLGTPSEKSPDSALWEFPSIDRLVLASRDGQGWCLMVTRRSLLSEEQIDSLVP